MNQKLFKVLDGLKSCHGGNHTWTLNEWVEVKGEITPCQNGIHLCREGDLIYWLHSDIYEAEYKGKIIESDNKVVVRKARITRRIEQWNDRSARLFACWCAEQVVYLTGDWRCLMAIEVSKEYANGLASREELAAAGSAAGSAARDAGSAARAAAWATAWDAAGDAARAAARAAARDAARDAAWATAWDAAWAAQTKKLMEVLYGPSS